MLSLTYFSTATQSFDRQALPELLNQTRSRNEKAGLTGLLLYADGNFVQTLEGPDDAVEATFRRIAQDTRHRSPSIAPREEITDRHFSDWSMGFREIEPEQARSMPGFSDFLSRVETPLAQGRGRGRGRGEVFHRAFRRFINR